MGGGVRWCVESMRLLSDLGAQRSCLACCHLLGINWLRKLSNQIRRPS